MGDWQWSSEFIILSHDQDTIHAETVCAEMCDFCMAALMFLTGHGIKARTHACAEIAHLPTGCIIGTWRANQIKSTWAWVFAILTMASTMQLVNSCRRDVVRLGTFSGVTGGGFYHVVVRHAGTTRVILVSVPQPAPCHLITCTPAPPPPLTPNLHLAHTSHFHSYIAILSVPLTKTLVSNRVQGFYEEQQRFIMQAGQESKLYQKRVIFWQLNGQTIIWLVTVKWTMKIFHFHATFMEYNIFDHPSLATYPADNPHNLT